uniref:Histone-lysine N-methyltransferase SUV420H2 n=1 Tax=Schizaphis graminum TaxID=13262 RepID=A0A2S2NMP6_SCHGA
MSPIRPKWQILASADDVATAETVDKMLGFTTHKTGTTKFQLKTKREKDLSTKLKEMYKKSLQDISYRYEKNYRFKNKLNDVKVVATQSISYGKIIRTLCGMTAAIKPEDIKIGVNDFSILTSSRTKKDLLFLGPAAYINHSCQYNTEWVAGHGEGVWCAKAIENIPIGYEITTYYGDNYFGVNQKDCECGCHPFKNMDVQDPIAKVKSPVTQVESMGEHNQDTDDTEDSDTRVGSMDVQNQPEYQTADPIAKVKSPVTQAESMGEHDQPENQTAVPIAKFKSPVTQVESMDVQNQPENQTAVPIATVKSPVTQVESMGEHDQDTDDEEDSDTDDAEDSDTDVGSMDEQEQPEYQTEVPIAKVKSHKTDCLTRWNSTYDMLERLQYLKDFIQNMSVNDKTLKKVALSYHDWQQVETISKALLPAKVCSTKLQTEQLTMTDFYGAWIFCKIQTNAMNSDFANKLVQLMTYREKIILNNQVLLAAIFLDPRYNITLSREQSASAIQHLTNIWICLKKIELNNQEVNTISPEYHQNTSDSLNPTDPIDDLEIYLRSKVNDESTSFDFGSLSNSQTETIGTKIETLLKSFSIEEKRLCHKINILQFWKSKKLVYPELFELSNIVFSVLATQVSVERLFSGLKFVLSPYRCNISAKNLENQLLVRTNMLFEKNKNIQGVSK